MPIVQTRWGSNNGLVVTLSELLAIKAATLFLCSMKVDQKKFLYRDRCETMQKKATSRQLPVYGGTLYQNIVKQHKNEQGQDEHVNQVTIKFLRYWGLYYTWEIQNACSDS
jgi:hypothetical protein